MPTGVFKAAAVVFSLSGGPPSEVSRLSREWLDLNGGAVPKWEAMAGCEGSGAEVLLCSFGGVRQISFRPKITGNLHEFFKVQTELQSALFDWMVHDKDHLASTEPLNEWSLALTSLEQASILTHRDNLMQLIDDDFSLLTTWGGIFHAQEMLGQVAQWVVCQHIDHKEMDQLNKGSYVKDLDALIKPGAADEDEFDLPESFYAEFAKEFRTEKGGEVSKPVWLMEVLGTFAYLAWMLRGNIHFMELFNELEPMEQPLLLEYNGEGLRRRIGGWEAELPEEDDFYSLPSMFNETRSDNDDMVEVPAAAAISEAEPVAQNGWLDAWRFRKFVFP